MQANKYLVTHNETRQAIAQGQLHLRPAGVIPADNYCMGAQRARDNLYVDSSPLQDNKHMPTWDELRPSLPHVWVRMEKKNQHSEEDRPPCPDGREASYERTYADFLLSYFSVLTSSLI